MLFNTKKGTQRKRKDESKKHMHKKNKRSIRKRDDDGEIVKIELKFHTTRSVVVVATSPFQKRIYICTFCALFCELPADFHAKESLAHFLS